MNLTVYPSKKLKGSVSLPGSKSYSIRAFIIAACGGRSRILCPSHGRDVLVSMRVAKSLGADVRRRKADTFIVQARKHPMRLKKIHVQESGTLLRFILPLASLYAKRSMITGEGTLRGRPNKFLTQTLRHMGVHISGKGKEESIPIKITGGSLRGGRVSIDGSLSSQFISALLITCPQLKEDSILMIKGKMVSLDYITMTLLVLRRAGVRIERRGTRSYIIKGRQKFRGLKTFEVPSDLGLAAFPMAAAALHSSDIVLKGHFKKDLIQADAQILTFLRKMGVRFTKTANAIGLKGPFALRGGVFSLKDCPDLVPIMAVLALFAKGTTRLRDVAHARSKESNRISDLRRELLKVGADVREKKDELIIKPKPVYRPNRLLDPHQDHRLAMAFCVLGTKLGVRIKDIECTSKSYPGFVKDLKSLGACLYKS